MLSGIGKNIRRYVCVCLGCLGCAITLNQPSVVHSQDDLFHVIAVDKSDSGLKSFQVRRTDKGLEINPQAKLSLPIKPTGLCSGPSAVNFVVTGTDDKGKSMTFAAEISKSKTGKSRTGQSNIVDLKLKTQKGTAVSYSSGYTSVDRTGRYYLSADYRRGAVAAYALESDGTIGQQTSLIELPEKSAHFIFTTPDNRFAYVPCVKENNAIFQFAFDQRSGELKPLKPFVIRPPALFGPRHAAYHPHKPIVYFSNEQQLGVSAYAIADDGQLSGLQHAATIPRRSPYIKGKRGMHASDIAITRDARWLWVALRDFQGSEDSVFTFKIESDGRLSLAHRAKVGDIPWKISPSPDDQFLLVSTIGDQKLSVFEIKPDGSLTSSAELDWGLQARDMVTVELN